MLWAYGRTQPVDHIFWFWAGPTVDNGDLENGPEICKTTLEMHVKYPDVDNDAEDEE